MALCEGHQEGVLGVHGHCMRDTAGTAMGDAVWGALALQWGPWQVKAINTESPALLQEPPPSWVQAGDTGTGHLTLFPCRLGGCSLTAAGCRAVASVLAAVPGLALLDLSDNAVGDDGVRELCAVLDGSGRGLWKLEYGPVPL